MSTKLATSESAVDMSEGYYVYARTLEPLVRAAKRRGMSLDPCFDAVSFDRERLDHADDQIPWGEFVVWCEIFERLIEPVGGLDEIGKGMTGSSYEGILRGFLGLFASPRWVFRLMQRWFGPSLFPMVRTDYKEKGGEIWITINFPSSLGHEPIFFRICRVIFAYAPTLISSQPAHVEVEHSDGEGIFRIIPPPSSTILSRLKRAWHAITSRDVVLGELTLQHDRLVNNYRSLQSAHEELARNAELLEESERRLKLATEATADGIFEISDSGKLAFASSRFAQILRYDDPENLSFDTWRERIVERDRHEFDQALRMLREGYAETVGVELAIEDRGNRYYVAMRATCEERATGLRIVGSLNDVTTRVRQKQKLERSESNFRTLINDSPQCIIVYGRDGTAKFVNPVFAEAVGRNSSELEGAQVEKLSPEASVGLGHELGRQEVQLIGDDDVRIFDLVVVEISFNQQDAFMAVGRDVTEEKELTARLREMDRMVAVGTLAAGVAHEINNPLAYIQSNVEFSKREIARIAQESEDLTIRDALKELDDALGDSLDGTRRVRDIVRDLRGFSHEETDAVEPVLIEEVIISSVNMAWHEIRHRALLETEFQDIPAVRANESRMGQVVLNLIVNAAQAIEEGDPTHNRIVIRTYVEDEWGVVEVRDTGRGIPEEKLSRIFDPFFTTKPVGEGTGLGLSISRNVVKRFGGMIELDSEEDKGTVARVKLPLANEHLLDEESETLLPDSFVDDDARSILVIDDDVNIGTMMQRILSNRYKVVFMHGGIQALEHLEAVDGVYDLIISDQRMPGLSGMDVFEKVVAREPEYINRFALMTGGSTEMPENAPPLLSKPFGTAELRAFLRQRFKELEVRSTDEINQKEILESLGN